MQSIVTKYLGPTNTSGARVKATSTSGKSVTVPYRYESDDGDHDAVAVKLAAKLGWTGTLVRGGTKGGYVYVFANDHHVTIGANAAGGRRRTAHRAGGKRAHADSAAKVIRSLARQDTAGDVDDYYGRTGNAVETIRRWRKAGREAGDLALVQTIDSLGEDRAAKLYVAARKGR